jgi:hypothetical protein
MVGDLLHRLHPAQQAFLERARVDPRQDAREGVVGRDAVGQVKEPSEPGPAVEAELLDRGERVGPGEDTADGDEDDVDQGVFAGPLDAWVGEVLEVVLERGGLAAGHGDDPSKAGRVISVGRSVVRKACSPSPREFAILMRRPWG